MRQSFMLVAFVSLFSILYAHLILEPRANGSPALDPKKVGKGSRQPVLPPGSAGGSPQPQQLQNKNVNALAKSKVPGSPVGANSPQKQELAKVPGNPSPKAVQLQKESAEKWANLKSANVPGDPSPKAQQIMKDSASKWSKFRSSDSPAANRNPNLAYDKDGPCDPGPQAQQSGQNKRLSKRAERYERLCGTGYTPPRGSSHRDFNLVTPRRSSTSSSALQPLSFQPGGSAYRADSQRASISRLDQPMSNLGIGSSSGSGSTLRLPSEGGPSSSGSRLRLPSEGGPSSSGSKLRLPSEGGPSSTGSKLRLPSQGGPSSSSGSYIDAQGSTVITPGGSDSRSSLSQYRIPINDDGSIRASDRVTIRRRPAPGPRRDSYTLPSGGSLPPLSSPAISSSSQRTLSRHGRSGQASSYSEASYGTINRDQMPDPLVYHQTPFSNTHELSHLGTSISRTSRISTPLRPPTNNEMFYIMEPARQSELSNHQATISSGGYNTKRLRRYNNPGNEPFLGYMHGRNDDEGYLATTTRGQRNTHSQTSIDDDAHFHSLTCTGPHQSDGKCTEHENMARFYENNRLGDLPRRARLDTVRSRQLRTLTVATGSGRQLAQCITSNPGENSDCDSEGGYYGREDISHGGPYEQQEDIYQNIVDPSDYPRYTRGGRGRR